jgi:hypothetical protein
MIWLLIVITISGNISSIPFDNKEECEVHRKWIVKSAGENVNSMVKSSVCTSVWNIYRR